MRFWGRRSIALGLCAGALLASGACSSAASKHLRPAPPPAPADVCPSSRIQVPECGVLWGVATQTPSIASVADLESRLGRRFDMVYRFHQLGDTLPTDDERKIVASGRLLHVSLDSGGLAASGTWGAIAAGTYDDQLRRAAEGVASLQKPVFVTFDHEANNPSKVVLGSPSQFAAAWRHVHQVFDQAGATNAVWVWVMMGAPETLPGVGAFWPGNSDVDWISWDVYNQSGCLAGSIDPARYESFREGMAPFYSWVHDAGSAVGIDPDKPMMISEAGSVVYPDDPQLTAQWYAEIPGVLAQYPQIRAIGLWDHTGNRLCDYRFEDDPSITAAVTQAGQDARVTSEDGS